MRRYGRVYADVWGLLAGLPPLYAPFWRREGSH